MVYSVRMRDLATGAEEWLTDKSGNRIEWSERGFADIAAYGAFRLAAGKLPFVVELDEEFEVPV